ncbi:MAG: zinc protease, partial [Polaribacter sp.]
MKKTITRSIYVALLFLCTYASAQQIDLNDPLPIDKTFRKGVLPNGMTYYIKNTDVTKNVASYYIIQNVGSILEKDNQQGLAHFLEHMAFNGTKNFAGKGILNTMEKQGLIFGRDIN